MNPSTLIGILVSTAFLAVVLLFAVDDPMLFVDVPGLAIVLGGTLAATFLSYPLREVLRIFHLVGTVFRHDRLNTSKDIDELVRMSRLWIQGDLRAVEQALAQVTAAHHPQGLHRDGQHGEGQREPNPPGRQRRAQRPARCRPSHRGRRSAPSPLPPRTIPPWPDRSRPRRR